MKNQFLRQLIAAFIACVPSLGAPIPANLLQVHFIDVVTGDCIWIHTGDDGTDGNGRMEGYNIIIDGGDWGRFGRADGYVIRSSPPRDPPASGHTAAP